MPELKVVLYYLPNPTNKREMKAFQQKYLSLTQPQKKWSQVSSEWLASLFCCRGSVVVSEQVGRPDCEAGEMGTYCCFSEVPTWDGLQSFLANAATFMSSEEGYKPSGIWTLPSNSNSPKIFSLSSVAFADLFSLSFTPEQQQEKLKACVDEKIKFYRERLPTEGAVFHVVYVPFNTPRDQKRSVNAATQARSTCNRLRQQGFTAIPLPKLCEVTINFELSSVFTAHI